MHRFSAPGNAEGYPILDRELVRVSSDRLRRAGGGGPDECLGHDMYLAIHAREQNSNLPRLKSQGDSGTLSCVPKLNVERPAKRNFIHVAFI
jgi:hypothetical protein